MTLEQLRMFGLSMLRQQHGYLCKLAQVTHIATQGGTEDVKRLIKSLEVKDPSDLEQQEQDRLELWKDFQEGFVNVGND